MNEKDKKTRTDRWAIYEITKGCEYQIRHDDEPETLVATVTDEDDAYAIVNADARIQFLEQTNRKLVNALDAIRMYAGDNQWIPCAQCTPAAELIVEMCNTAFAKGLDKLS